MIYKIIENLILKLLKTFINLNYFELMKMKEVNSKIKQGFDRDVLLDKMRKKELSETRKEIDEKISKRRKKLKKYEEKLSLAKKKKVRSKEEKNVGHRSVSPKLRRKGEKKKHSSDRKRSKKKEVKKKSSKKEGFNFFGLFEGDKKVERKKQHRSMSSKARNVGIKKTHAEHKRESSLLVVPVKEIPKEELKKIQEKELGLDKNISEEYTKKINFEKEREKEMIKKKEFALDKKISKDEEKKRNQKLKLLREKELNLDRKISQDYTSKIRKKEWEKEQERTLKREKIREKELTLDESVSEKYNDKISVQREKEKEAKKIEEDELLKKEKQEKLQILVDEHSRDISALRKEVARIVVGHDRVVNSIMRGLLAKGHVLIEGVPGIAKTLLIRAVAHGSGCKFSRIQFTVDLLPTDITGVTTYNEKTGDFSTLKGPIFSNFIIADEINRAPPKTQSALLEAMQEKQVTIGKNTHKLEEPFFVMANNNPIESSGTYPLPEAQIDRFLFKVKMGYTSPEQEVLVIDQNITINQFEDFKICPIITPAKIIKMQKTTKSVFASERIKKYIVRIVNATRDSKKYDIKLGKYIEWGCSPRASIGLTIAAKADAVLKGSTYITPQNIKNVAYDVLRHRIILNYRGQAENIKPEDIITEIFQKVPVP